MEAATFNDFTYEQLLGAKTHIDNLIEERREEVRQQFRNETMEKATKLGLDIVEVLCAIEARYRDPDNPKNTWGGKGRKPKWLLDYLEQGHDLSEYGS